MARMLGVPRAQIPEYVLTEYEIRLGMYHRDGASGPIGSLALIDMLRSMGLGLRPPAKEQPGVDWARIPNDGSVRVLARINTSDGEKQVSGVYKGRTRGGSLGILVDGDAYMHEVRPVNVRIAREGPMQPISSEDAFESDVPIAKREPWVSLDVNEIVLVTDEGVYKEGKFQAVDGDEVLVLVSGDLSPRQFARANVRCLLPRLQAIRKKQREAEQQRLAEPVSEAEQAEQKGEEDAELVHSNDHD